MCSRPESSEIVSTIVELARSLGMDVVAEGVETQDQLDKLSELGCGNAQGYYLARRSDAARTQAFIREQVELDCASRVLLV
jgi:EAL domain-containing protein (putative c-di-GMP-specific phosphodiesterase class I)